MITVLGIGPGKQKFLINNYQDYLRKADIILGSKRQIELFQPYWQKCFSWSSLQELKRILFSHLKQKIILLASGDPLIFGIGNWVIKNFGKEHVDIIPGISSIQYMFSRLGLSMNQVYLASSHGQKPDFNFLLKHQTIGMVTDNKFGPFEIAQEIKKYHQHRKIFVGERLSYPGEKISEYNENNIKNRIYKMNVVIITDER